MSTEEPEVPAEEEETDNPEFGDSEPDDAVDASDE